VTGSNYTANENEFEFTVAPVQQKNAYLKPSNRQKPARSYSLVEPNDAYTEQKQQEKRLYGFR
jgi:hypothetical protein